MKALINTAAGWLKILTYAATIVGMAMGWIEPKVALMISMIASAVIKIATEITRITPNTKDDVFVAEIEKILKDKGVIKTA